MWKTAFEFMTYEKAKLSGILLGIVISIVLVGIQFSLVDSFLYKATGFLRGNHQYIYVVDRNSTSSSTLAPIDNRVGYELRSIPGVAKVHPVIVSSGACKFPSGGSSGACIVGVQYPDMAGAPQQYTAGTNLARLQNEGAVIIDEKDLPKVEKLHTGSHFYLNNHRVCVAGLSVGNDGLGTPYIVTTIDRARQLTGFDTSKSSAFLIEANTADTLVQRRIVQDINRIIPYVKAYTGPEFVTVSNNHDKQSNGLLGIFYLMITFALITGGIIVGLTMFSSVNDRIRDYGTIKAIGGSNKVIFRLISCQAVLYAAIGFLIAVALLYLLKIPLGVSFSLSLLASLFLMTLVLSCAGSFFCLRKICKLEPVQIFRM